MAAKVLRGCKKEKKPTVMYVYCLLGWGVERADGKRECEEERRLPLFPCSPM